MIYQIGDAKIVVPDHWVDKSIVALSAPAQHSEHVPENIVFNRDSLAELSSGGLEDFENYISRQVAALEEKVPHFQRLPPEYDIDSDVQREVTFVWKTSQTSLRQSMIVTNHHPPGILTLTLTCADAEFKRVKPEFVQILSSIDFTALS